MVQNNVCHPPRLQSHQKSNPWIDEECRKMLKTRWALDRKVHKGGGPSDELKHTPNDYLPRKMRIMDQVCVTTQHLHTKHVWNRVRKISGKNVCPTKQYLNRKDGAPITDPKDIANSIRIHLQQHSQVTPPLPTTVPDSRPSRLKMKEPELSSPLIIL